MLDVPGLILLSWKGDGEVEEGGEEKEEVMHIW